MHPFTIRYLVTPVSNRNYTQEKIKSRSCSENACYCSIQKVLPCRFLPNNGYKDYIKEIFKKFKLFYMYRMKLTDTAFLAMYDQHGIKRFNKTQDNFSNIDCQGL